MQMKHFLPIALIFLLSWQSGSTLECYTCAQDCKSNTKMTCPPIADRCFSISAKQGNTNIYYKGCLSSLACNQDFANLPHGFPSMKPTCCDKDLCNSAFTNVMSLGTAILLALVSLCFAQF
ncbi:lymphocyte antigen 6E-like [Pyxicephalus adspersus]|uniref:UPAR/Ly6 domain-containing protein n=1 Tax=Pyxicephalus adspersus TaxID=30357 RepID=A0AAV2ZYU8_PYXAD|nr:TPA: hypothetical protein GDO54_017310 [Pyxicephalus adspersus]